VGTPQEGKGAQEGQDLCAPLVRVMDGRVRELVLIFLLATFCGGLACALDHDELFAVAFAGAAVTGAFGAVAALLGIGGS
jgi:hypothetical protein